MFVKTVKNKAYHKRFQVRFKRRRQGKTDYYQRKRLITQRKNKYNTPKYRFVVRRTNRKIVCQIVSSTLDGDLVKAQALSSELRKYGLTAGLTNYAACYATGLLCARRLLTTLDKENAKLEGWTSLASRFNLVPETTGDYVNIEKLAETKDIGRPFVCFLDLGLYRSTNGARVFAAMKGAVDGGVHIPHKDTIFPKVKDAKKDKDGKKVKDAPKTDGKTPVGNPFRERLFGVHVQKYMDHLAGIKDKKGMSNLQQFSKWNKCLADAKVTKVEDLYKKVFTEIRKNPDRPKGKRNNQVPIKRDTKDNNVVINGKHKYRRDKKINNQQRRNRVNERIAKFVEERKKLAAANSKKK